LREQHSIEVVLMPAKKGTIPPAAGMGRKKGVPNKVTGDLRTMVLQALSAAGGVEYLLAQAHSNNPAPFMALVGKCIPKDIQVTAKVSLTQLLQEAEARRKGQ
jgi:hypothetical protein